MQRADFYQLQSSETEARLYFACRLAEKAWRQSLCVLLYVVDENQAEQLDRLLWALREDAFIPHDIWKESLSLAEDPFILISWSDNPSPLPPLTNGLWINLSSELTPPAQGIVRVAEIVIEDPTTKNQMRQHYRVFKQQGLSTHVHQIDANE